MEKNFNTDDNNIRFIIESSLAKLEKANTRLWIIVILLIVALIGTNAGWLVYESQYEDSVTTQTVTQEATSDGDSDIVIKSVGGDYYGGESETDSYNNN